MAGLPSLIKLRAVPVQKALDKLAAIDPLSTPAPEDSPGLNREKLFLTFSTLGGDITRTAHASNLSPAEVSRIVTEEKWLERLQPILELSKGEKKGDVERGINRAINFAVAHRMRLVLERSVEKIFSMSDAELEEFLFQTETDKNGVSTRKLSTRPLADLAAAAEKICVMTYLALGDSVSERTKRTEDTTVDSVSSLHAVLADAVSKVREASPGPTATRLAATVEAKIESGSPCDE